MNRSLKTAKSEYFEELINSSQNPNRFWQGIKRALNGDNRLQSNLLIHNEKLVNGSKLVANMFNNYFVCKNSAKMLTNE